MKFQILKMDKALNLNVYPAEKFCFCLYFYKVLVEIVKNLNLLIH